MYKHRCVSICWAYVVLASPLCMQMYKILTPSSTISSTPSDPSAGFPGFPRRPRGPFRPGRPGGPSSP